MSRANPYGIQIRIHDAEDIDATLINVFRLTLTGKLRTLHLESKGWVGYKDFERWKEPTLVIDGPDKREVLQELSEQLVRHGIIPSQTKEQVSDLEQTIEAKDLHISDLQKVLSMVLKKGLR